VTAAVALVVAVAAPAQGAVPDKWARWVSPTPDVTIRSLDFLGPGLFASGETNGVFSSPGSTFGPWSQQNTGLDAQTGAQSVRQVKVGPNGLLYAATTAGLFSAQPGGAWSPVGQGSGPRRLNMGGIQSIVFNDPSGMDMAVAVAGAGGAGVYYSSDGGVNWDRASGMSNPQNVFFLTSTPSGTPMYAAADDGVFVSFDFGRSWILNSDGIPPGETTLRVAYAPDNPAHLYASTSSGVYRSTNAGITWEQAEGSDNQTLPAAGGKRAFILTPPLNGQFGQNRAVVGTEQGAWATIDDGAHWGQMSTEAIPASPDMNRIVWSLGLGFTPPSLLAGTAGFGIYAVPLQPVEDGDVVIGPFSGLNPGDELTHQKTGFAGTRPIFFSYQWLRCQGNGCTPTTPIPGATGPSYVIPPGDAGLRVRYALSVTARNLVHPTFESDVSGSTIDADVAAAPGTTPRPTFVVANQPKLSPTTSQPWGTQYTITNGNWRTEADPADITAQSTFEYRWERCQNLACETIPGATGQTYTTTPADIAYSLNAYIRATRAGVSSPYYLAGTAQKVMNKFPVNTVAPKIVGDPYSGVLLSSSAGGWDGHDMTYERRWLRCEADGLGCNPTNPVVTGPTYQLGTADLGKRLQLEVTAVAEDESQDRRTTALSLPTPVITEAPTVQPPQVKIKAPKKLKKGSKLKVPKAFPGFSDPKFQWLRGKKPIKKATKNTYKLTRKDLGKKIACRITLIADVDGSQVVATTKAIKVPKKKKK
jgi:hypothetical protein